MKRFLSLLLCAFLIIGPVGCGVGPTFSQTETSNFSEESSSESTEHTSQVVSENKNITPSSSNPSSSNPSSSKVTVNSSSAPTSSSISSSKVQSTSQATSSKPQRTEPLEGWENLGNILIFGDSFSSYHKDGDNDKYPYGNTPYYPNAANGVTKLEDMWFSQVISQTNSTLLRNDSLSGATICGTSYGQDIYNSGNGWCFIARLEKLIKQGYFSANKVDTIFIFGGTNDISTTPVGEIKYRNWNTSDIMKPIPAASYFFDKLRRNVPNTTKIYFVLNGRIKTANPALYEAYKDYCKKWAIGFIECNNIQTASNNHPNAAGMKSISEDIINYLKYVQ